MAAQRPRLSVLSLFDPLSSSSSDSPDSDKENDCGDSSFFHPYGFSNQAYSPVRRLRRRLIDIGDMTIEEPDIRDLIEEELEAEINQTFTLEEDENATLTFRDMAKAATPKWSGKHAGRKGTPNTLSTPRTPLAEIVTRDEITPVGRKKIFKRPPASSVPASSPLNAVHIVDEIPTLVIHHLDNISGNPTFVPPTVILPGDNETSKNFTSPSSMGASTATLELPTPSGTLISDTPIPLFVLSPSPEPDHAPPAPSPSTENRLRPNAHVSESSNRHSVDLHASFQMHISSSDTTFDLLNDKISFFSSKSGLESFLDHEGASFCDDEDFGAMNHERSSELVSNEQRTGHSETELNMRKLDVSETTLEEHDNDHDARDRHASFHGRNGIPTSPTGKKSSYAVETVESVPDTPPSKAENAVLSTPGLLHRPRPVPALRIVKRTEASEQAKAAERNRCDSRSTSRRKTSNISALGPKFNQKLTVSGTSSPKRTSVVDASFILTGNGMKNGQARAMDRSVPSAVKGDQTTGGPRRVLAAEVPKVRDIACTKARPLIVQAKSVNGIHGPRRVQASNTINAKADLPASNMAKQPGKNSSVRVAGSGIPKPVTSRTSGLRIAAPPSSNQRIGVQIETGRGFLGRRLAGK